MNKREYNAQLSIIAELEAELKQLKQKIGTTSISLRYKEINHKPILYSLSRFNSDLKTECLSYGSETESYDVETKKILDEAVELLHCLVT